MSSQPHSIWYHLIDLTTGQSYRHTTASSVKLFSYDSIDDCRQAIRDENRNKLATVDASDLLVYKNKEAFDNRTHSSEEGYGGYLHSAEFLDGLGTKQDMLVIAVPSNLYMSTNMESKDISKNLYKTLTNPFDRQPAIYELKEILSAAPAEAIPLVPSLYDAFTKYFLEDDMEHFQKYFRRSSVEHVNITQSLHLLSTMKVNLGTGESNLHYYVDFFMQNFLEVVLFSLSLRIDIDRNTADLSKTSLEKLRPDFLFYVQDFLILRGEEKSSISTMEDAKNELIFPNLNHGIVQYSEN